MIQSSSQVAALVCSVCECVCAHAHVCVLLLSIAVGRAWPVLVVWDNCMFLWSVVHSLSLCGQGIYVAGSTFRSAVSTVQIAPTSFLFLQNCSCFTNIMATVFVQIIFQLRVQLVFRAYQGWKRYSRVSWLIHEILNALKEV